MSYVIGLLVVLTFVAFGCGLARLAPTAMEGILPEASHDPEPPNGPLCGRCKVGDHSKHYPQYGGICIGCGCPEVIY